ncbi:MAG: MFS transporter [Desulfovibrionaceae bacterium]|nr:MFS transporter [Desulfovibrionaceae bacterium]
MPAHRRKRAARSAGTPGAGTREALRAVCSRNFAVITLVNFLVMVVYYLIFVTITAYARATFHLSLSLSGLSSGLLIIGCLAGRFFTGSLLPVLGLRPALFAGLGIFSASIGCFFLSDSAAGLFLQRFVCGTGVGIAGTVTGSLVAWVVPPEHRGFGVSVFSMSTALALALGPFLGILLSGLMPYADRSV